MKYIRILYSQQIFGEDSTFILTGAFQNSIPDTIGNKMTYTYTVIFFLCKHI